jgi:hypothetical protein
MVLRAAVTVFPLHEGLDPYCTEPDELTDDAHITTTLDDVMSVNHG